MDQNHYSLLSFYTLGRIIEDSPADRSGELRLGDHILAVNHVDIMSLHHGEIVNLIKDSGYSVTLTIGAPVTAGDDASSTTSHSASAYHRVSHYDKFYFIKGVTKIEQIFFTTVS